jgi:hypothetical protein
MPRLLKSFAPQDGRQSETALFVARGTRRMLRRLDFSTVAELPLLSGRRADIVALASDGTILIVEIKSSVADYRADSKWQDYRAHCDRLFFAIPETVPSEIMLRDAGLILADARRDCARGAGAPDGARHPPRDADPLRACGGASPAPVERS